MTGIGGLIENLGIAELPTEKRGVYWLDPGSLNVRDLATQLNALKARFVTITARQLPGSEGICLEYHWDLDGQLLGFSFATPANSIDSIYDLCEAVDWIEREIHEGFAVDFLGREYEPLLLRVGDIPGLNLREVAK